MPILRSTTTNKLKKKKGDRLVNTSDPSVNRLRQFTRFAALRVSQRYLKRSGEKQQQPNKEFKAFHCNSETRSNLHILL
jgi:hypothetical protein